MTCHCGRAARGFGYQHPQLRGAMHPACSMACLDTLVARKGDMKELNASELDAVENAMRQHLPDTRAMFADNPTDETLLEWLAWAYIEICNQVRIEYDKPITGKDIPF